jgi:hypothetical protein
MIHMLRQLDEHRFLGFPIWEFSFRSLPRLYGCIFLRDMLLRHPLRTLKGMLAYRRFFRQGQREGDVTRLYAGTEADLREAILAGDGRFLVALGFCQKPMDCPAGRFNHVCHVLARDDILEISAGRLPIACGDCDVRVIGTSALRAGAAVYIMTSAADIARHLFIPSLERDGFLHGLFLQCPYSVPAMILPLLICGIHAMLVGYSEGDCQDYPQFLLADEGTKDERTQLNPTAHAHVVDFLQGVASARRARGQGCRHFRWDGCLYVPTIIRERDRPRHLHQPGS